MCEMVKRNNGGRLDGLMWGVDDNLIEETKKLAEEGWDGKTPRKIAKIIINGVPLFELDLIRDGHSTKTRSMFTLPGNRRVSVPIVIENEAGSPKLFLDTTAKIKQA